MVALCGAMPTLIFVHGACVRDAAWWWSKMTEPLARRGIATTAVPLPSCGERGETLGEPAEALWGARLVSVTRAPDLGRPAQLGRTRLEWTWGVHAR
jgi:hypothetical protein